VREISWTPILLTALKVSKNIGNESVLPRLDVLFLVLFLLASNRVAAQVPSISLFGGYSYLNAEVGQKRVSVSGWNGSGEVRVARFIGVVADFGGQYGSPNAAILSACPITNTGPCPQPKSPQTVSTLFRQYTFLFGPRFSVNEGRLRPFAEALVGGARVREQTSSIALSDTTFSYAAGIGVDYRLSRRFGWRVEADALQTRHFSTSQTDLRVSTGLVIQF
jgi:opacity protein-like surface antigen